MDQTDQTLKGGGGERADSLLDNSSNGSNSQGGDNQGDLINQPNLDLPAGWYETDCLELTSPQTLQNQNIISIKYLLGINGDVNEVIKRDTENIYVRTLFTYKETGCRDTNGYVNSAFNGQRHYGPFSRHRIIGAYRAHRDFGNNTSYFIASNSYALPFHIDNNGALYIGHNTYNDSIGVKLDSNSVVEDIFSDFINDPTIGIRYRPIPSILRWNSSTNKWSWPSFYTLTPQL